MEITAVFPAVPVSPSTTDCGSASVPGRRSGTENSLDSERPVGLVLGLASAAAPPVIAVVWYRMVARIALAALGV
jgi:hypothetical protein